MEKETGRPSSFHGPSPSYGDSSSVYYDATSVTGRLGRTQEGMAFPFSLHASTGVTSHISSPIRMPGETSATYGGPTGFLQVRGPPLPKVRPRTYAKDVAVTVADGRLATATGMEGLSTITISQGTLHLSPTYGRHSRRPSGRFISTRRATVPCPYSATDVSMAEVFP